MDPVITWLLEGDPSVRFQTRRLLLGDTGEVDRGRLESHGWGAALLSHQDDDGTWAGALYSPKWTSTTYTLLELHDLGLRPGCRAAARGVEKLIEGAKVYDHGGLTLAKTVPSPEACITAMLVKLAAWTGVADQKIDDAVEWLIQRQLPDGGWNCLESSHGSFHTSISVLEALAEPGTPAVPAEVVEAGRRFFLEHRLYRSHRTGAVAAAEFTRFSFPPRWHFDVMRGLWYFAAAEAHRDVRLTEAIELVRRRMRPDGRWPVERSHPGRTWHTMERGPGPSRWNTLRARRVLRWWDVGPVTH
ncbi:MAG: prenyltransferase/squalene oxidase repeat-containing protein [Acidimicrobiia bacterium]